MLAQLAWLFEREQEELLEQACRDRGGPSDVDLEEADRLRGIAGELFARAFDLGQAGTGLDHCFGDDAPES
jgi:hypothetical protein